MKWYLYGFFLFCLQINHLEAEMQKISGDQLLAIKDNLNTLFAHCIETLGHEHNIRVVYALQVGTVYFCVLMWQIHVLKHSYYLPVTVEGCFILPLICRHNLVMLCRILFSFKVTGFVLL